MFSIYESFQRKKIRKVINGNNLDVLKQIVQNHDEDYQYKDYSLQIAIEHNKLEFVKYLLSNFKYVDSYINILLQTAADNENIEIVRCLLQNHVENNSVSSLQYGVCVYNDYAMRVAAQYGYLEIVKHLLQNGVNINYTDDDFCFSNTHGYFTLIKRCKTIRLTPEIQSELCSYHNRIIRIKSAIIKI